MQEHKTNLINLSPSKDQFWEVIRWNKKGKSLKDLRSGAEFNFEQINWHFEKKSVTRIDQKIQKKLTEIPSGI